MARVAIVVAPIRASRDFIDYPWFADLGAVQAAAVLREAGHEVAVADALALEGATLAEAEAGEITLGAPLEAVLARVPADAEVVVASFGAFCRPPSRDPSLGALLEALRGAAPLRPIVLADLYQSGQHVVDAPPGDVLASYPEVDALLRFEAEDAIGPLVDALAEEARTTSARPSRRVVTGGEPDLARLPPPAWDLVDVDAYVRFHERVTERLGRPAWAFPIDGRSAPVVTTRGCPFRCVHCSSNPTSREDGALVRPKTQRRRPLEAIDRELALLASRGFRRVHVLDELANVNEAHFDGLLALLEKHGLRYEIPNGLRADYVLERHLEAMRERLTTLSVSAESGSKRVLDEIVDKDLELDAITRVAERAAAAGVPLLVHFLIGLPGETRAEINETLAYAASLFDRFGARPSVQFATPLPGTRLARLARDGARSLPLARDWGPRFQGGPSMHTEHVSADELARFKRTFDARMAAASGPKKVVLNVTYKCNNHCTFCATGTRTQLDGDTRRQRELLVKYRKLGVRLLDLDGGEPTLHPGLVGLVGFARRIGYERVNVTTNARLAAYDDFAEKLATSGVTSVLVSIHGPDAQTHAQNVGVAEAFDQTVAGLRNLVRLAPPHVELGVNVTITKSNHQKLDGIASLAWDLGVRWLNLQFLTPFGRATSSVAPDTRAAAAIAARVIDAWKGRMKIEVINLPFCFLPGHEAHMTGDLLKLERHMLFVNNDEVNLADYLRERRVKQPVCDGCEHAIFCGGFFDLDDAPEPTWLVRPEDLVRTIAPEVPRARIT
jgi:MoaA/NifB/PqqE/SkfB family radical SAM enzyme